MSIPVRHKGDFLLVPQRLLSVLLDLTQRRDMRDYVSGASAVPPLLSLVGVYDLPFDCTPRY